MNIRKDIFIKNEIVPPSPINELRGISFIIVNVNQNISTICRVAQSMVHSSSLINS